MLNRHVPMISRSLSSLTWLPSSCSRAPRATKPRSWTAKTRASKSFLYRRSKGTFMKTASAEVGICCEGEAKDALRVVHSGLGDSTPLYTDTFNLAHRSTGLRRSVAQRTLSETLLPPQHSATNHATAVTINYLFRVTGLAKARLTNDRARTQLQGEAA